MRPLLLALFATFLILATAACSGDDQSAEPAPSVPVEQGTPGDPVDAEAPATSPGPATAEEVAAGFLEAYGAFEAERAITYLAEDADVSGLVSSVGQSVPDASLDDFRLLVALLEAVGYKQILQPCEPVGGSTSETILRCPFDFHYFRSDEIGLGPFSGSVLSLTVRDGEIVRVSNTFAISEFSPQVWEPVADWLSTAYPQDIAVMYVNGGTTTGVALTEESISL